MSDSHAASETRREPGQYEIRLKEHFEARWAAWFDGRGPEPSDCTGPVASQWASLHLLELTG